MADFFKDQFGQANVDGIDDFADAALFTPNTPLLAQVQAPPTDPGQTSGERAAGVKKKPKDDSDKPIEDTPGETARRKPGRQGKNPGFNQGARDRDGYTDDKCPGESRWACCVKKTGARMGGWFCLWLSDNSVCDLIACCMTSLVKLTMPDEYCPDFPPMRKKFSIMDQIEDTLGNWGAPIFGPSSGGAVGGAGAAAAVGGSQ